MANGKDLNIDEELGLEPDTVKLLQYSKGLDTPNIYETQEVKRLKAERESMKGETKAAYDEAAKAKSIEGIISGIFKALAAYKGLQTGEDLSKVEVGGTGVPELKLKGKLADIEERQQLATEGIRTTREDLAQRIRGAQDERDFKYRALEDKRRARLEAIREARLAAKEDEVEKASKFNIVKSNIGTIDRELSDKITEIDNLRTSLDVSEPKAGTTARVKFDSDRSKLGELLGVDLSKASTEEVAAAYTEYRDKVARERSKLQVLNKSIGMAEIGQVKWDAGQQSAWKVLSNAGPYSVASEVPFGSMRRSEATINDLHNADAEAQQKVRLAAQKFESQIPKKFFGDTPAEAAWEILKDPDKPLSAITEEQFNALPVSIKRAVIPVEKIVVTDPATGVKRPAKPSEIFRMLAETKGEAEYGTMGIEGIFGETGKKAKGK